VIRIVEPFRLVDLDPSVDAKGRIVRRWGIRANVTVGTPGGDW
jgi:hypothetical protein